MSASFDVYLHTLFKLRLDIDFSRNAELFHFTDFRYLRGNTWPFLNTRGCDTTKSLLTVRHLVECVKLYSYADKIVYLSGVYN